MIYTLVYSQIRFNLLKYSMSLSLSITSPISGHGVLSFIMCWFNFYYRLISLYIIYNIDYNKYILEIVLLFYFYTHSCQYTLSLVDSKWVLAPFTLFSIFPLKSQQGNFLSYFYRWFFLLWVYFDHKAAIQKLSLKHY